MSINRVIISGNLTRDPELRSTASGLPVLGFGVAVNDRRKNQQTGEWEDYPNFIDCTMFGARAESLSRYLGKGTKVAIEGKLRWSQWEREGQKRSKIEVIVDELEFMSSRNSDSSSYGGGMGGGYSAPAAAPVAAAPVVDASSSVYDEDIPFLAKRKRLEMSDYAKQPRRKFCQFCKEDTQYIDYKDTQMLRKYVTDRGKIKPRRVTGACTQHQRDIANAVKRAREMALMPYAVPAISGRGDRRSR